MTPPFHTHLAFDVQHLAFDSLILLDEPVGWRRRFGIRHLAYGIRHPASHRTSYSKLYSPTTHFQGFPGRTTQTLHRLWFVVDSLHEEVPVQQHTQIRHHQEKIQDSGDHAKWSRQQPLPLVPRVLSGNKYWRRFANLSIFAASLTGSFEDINRDATWVVSQPTNLTHYLHSSLSQQPNPTISRGKKFQGC
jgi:hypothetical protein